MSDVIQLLPGADLDALVGAGFYTVSVPRGGPLGNGIGDFIVIAVGSAVGGNARGAQIAWDIATGGQFSRTKLVSGWQVWSTGGSGGSVDPSLFDAAGTADAAVAAHVALADPHPQYLLETAAATTYDPINAASDAITAHLAASDPHTQYLNTTRGDARYQAISANLATLAGLTFANGKLIKLTGASSATLIDITATGTALLGAADAGAARSSLGLVIGTDVQPYDSDLLALAALAPTKGSILVGDGASWQDLGAGSNGQALVVDSAQTLGVKWFTLPGVTTPTPENIAISSGFSSFWDAYVPAADLPYSLLESYSSVEGIVVPSFGGPAGSLNAQLASLLFLVVNGFSIMDRSYVRAVAPDANYDGVDTAGTGITYRPTDMIVNVTDNSVYICTNNSVGTATWVKVYPQSGGGGGTLTDGDYGDIIVSGSGTAMNFDSSVVTTFALTYLAATTASATRAALGVSIGSNVQAWDLDLDAIAALTTQSFGRSLLTSASAAAVRTAIGTVIGTDVQAFDSTIINQAAGDVRYERIGRQFDTRTAAIAATVPASINFVRTAGYSAVGDLGGALYKKVGSAPSHNGKFQSADGAWWELTSFPVNPFMFGAAGDNATDDKNPLTDCFAFVASKSTYNNTMAYPMTGLGRPFATSIPQVPPSYIHLYDITFKALTGASWSGGNGTALSFGTQGVLTLSGGFQRLRNVQIDCNRITSVQGIYASGPNYQNSWENILVKNWKTNGNGIVLANYSLTEARNVDCLQYVNGDSEYTLSAQRTGVGMLLIGQTDSIFVSCNWANALTQLYVDVNSHHNRFTDCHPYCVSAPSTATANPGGIVYDGYQNVFDGLYLDVVPFVIRTSASSVLGKPSVTITDINGLYDSSNSTYASWIQFTTSLANTPLTDVRIENVQLNTVPPYSFATTGSGSWAHTSRALTALGAATTNSEIKQPNSTSTAFHNNVDMLGGGVLTGYLTTNVTDTGSARTLSTDDSGKLVLMTLNNTLTVTAPKAMTKGLDCLIFCPNHAGSIIAETGGSINGLTTAITLTQNQLYRLVWLFGTGANAQYCLMGGLGGGGGSAVLADGDYGDIVVSGTGTAINFDTSVVTTFAKTFLDDVAAVNVRATLGLVIGTNVQAWDADLDTWATLTPSANAQTLVGHTFSQMRTDLGLVIGTNVQAWDADLDAIAALVVGKGKLIVGSATAWNALAVATDGWVLTLDSTQTLGVKWAAPTGGGGTLADGDYGDIVVSGTGTAINFDTSVVTTFAKTFLDDVAAVNVRATLGLVIGTDVQAFDSDLTTWAGLTPSANAQTLVGHTFSQMRTDLGLVIGTNVQAWDADLDTIAALASTKGNIIVGGASGWSALAVGADTTVLTADSTATPGVKWGAAGGGSAALPRSYLAGLKISNNATTPNSKVDIAVGACRDDANAADITVGSVLTCNAATTGANGLQTGALAASTWYHVWVIAGTSGVASFMSTSLSPTLPSGYTTSKRRVGSVKTDASSNLLAFKQLGDSFIWAAPVRDVGAASVASVSRAAVTLPSVPPGIQVEWQGFVFYSLAGAVEAVVTSPDATDVAPDSVQNGWWVPAAPIAFWVDGLRTDTSQQLYHRETGSSGAVRFTTHGYRDRRGRDD